jgi:hypothetical protein
MNELSTLVPGGQAKVKGFDRMLSPADIAIVIGRPVRWVREKLIKTGVIASLKFGGNSVRVRADDFRTYLDKGATGFRNAKPSGRRI